MVLYPNKLPESERVCSGICNLARKTDYSYLQQMQHFLLPFYLVHLSIYEQQTYPFDLVFLTEYLVAFV